MRHRRETGARQDIFGQRFRWRTIVRGVPAFVWLVTLLHILVMVVDVGFWAPNRGPDEFRQVGLSVAVARGSAVPWPDPGTLSTTRGVQAGLLDPALAKGKTLYAARNAPATRALWPSYDDKGGDTAGIRPNQLVQHPPVFYYLMGGALHLLPDYGGRPYIDVYLLLRLLNVVLLAPFPLLVYAAARRLAGTGAAASASAAAVLAIPQFARNGASVENDNLLVIALTALMMCTAFVISGDTSKRTGLTIGALGVIALLTKGLALFLPLYLLVVYLYAAWRHGRGALAAGFVALAVSGIGGGWWWVRNIVTFGVIQPEGTQIEQNGLGPPLTTWAETGRHFAEGFARRLSYRFWMDAHVWTPPRWVEWVDGVLSVLLLVALVIGLLTARRRGLGSLRALILLIPVAAQLGIIIVGAWHGWVSTLFPAGQQGRYLYGGLLGVLIVAGSGLTAVFGSKARAVPVLVLVGGLGMTSLQFVYGLRVYYTPHHHTSYVDDLRTGAHNLLAWSPLPPVAFWTACAAAAVVAVLALVAAFYRSTVSNTDSHSAPIASGA